MHEAFTTATKNYAPDDLLPPIYLTNRPQQSNELDWQSDRQTIENWPPHRPSAFQKLSISTNMSSHTENVINRGNHWFFNNEGQLVDANALADEIVRLNMGDAAGEGTDDASIRTPPKTKLASAVLADTSPLETNSIPSTDSSPKGSDHQIVVSHSRGSSTDTTISSEESALSSTSNAKLAHAPLKTASISELKERPHSFSGGLSSADLRRLQQTDEGSSDDNSQQQQPPQWSGNQSTQLSNEQLSYPSLAPNNQTVHRPYAQQSNHGPQNTSRDDVSQSDYNLQQGRNFNAPQPGMAPNIQTSPPYIQGRPNNVPVPYRQPPRGFAPQQGMPLPSPGYAHTPHMSLGNSQQVYDMMLPGTQPHDPAHPAVSRVQQQHNVFPRAHHHSTSDPTAIRDPAALALLNNNMPFPGGIFPANLGGASQMPMQMYAQFPYGQDAYRNADPAAVAAAQVMANRLQAQYTGQYAMMSPQLDGGMPSPVSSSGNQNGPSANNRKLGLYKTELCRSWEEKGSCRYGAKCQFAHGEEELRKVSRHPKYKTEICRTFWVSGSCPYGKRCCFIHTELPNTAVPPAPGQAVDVPPPPSGHERSPSTNSDPNESVSLLARISAKRTDTGTNSSSTPVDNSSFQFSGAQKQRLKVDTSTLDRNSMKGQNKSAYPSFASNGVLMAAPENITAKSPAPVTAGPDLGRHNNARMEIVGYNQSQQRMNKTPPSNARHSTSGSEDISYQASQSMTGNSYALPSGDGNSSAPRVNGHVRAGSAGNWGNFATSNRVTSQFPVSAYPHAPSPAGEGPTNSPWSTTRLNEKAWA